MVKRASQILNGAEEKAMLESEAALRPKLLENLLDKDYERQEDREGATEIQEKDEGVLDEHAPLPPLTWKNILWFMGPGWLVSIAYVDPGNYQADISSGKATGYAQNWVVLWTSLLSIWCQILCIRLSQRCRQTLAEAMADEYPTVIRYLQYAIAEFSVIITDLPEVIGFGFAIKIFLGWPTWIGVLCSLATTMLFLSSQYFGFRALEGIIMCFVGIMSIVIFVQWSMTTTDWAMFWKGALIPGVSGIKPDALTILGLIGCVVMPHNLYLHSAAAMTRGDIPRTKKHVERAIKLSSLDLVLPIFVTIAINWGIVVLSAENIYQNPSAANSGIADFCRYFSNMGDAGCILWGVALLAAAQSSSITTTYTGQYVMEGFLKLRLSLWKRAILTRLLAILPAVAIAASYSDNTLQHMIDWVNASLAVLLPFALIPLIKFNTSERKMGSAVPSLVEKVALWILGVAVICVNVLTVKLQSKEDSKPFNFLWDLKHNTVQNLLLLAYVLFLVYVFLKPVRGKKGNYREIRSFEPAF